MRRSTLIGIATLVVGPGLPGLAEQVMSPAGQVPGMRQAAVGPARLDTFSDPSGGAVAQSADYTLKPGYAGQLFDVVSLEATPDQDPVNEEGANLQILRYKRKNA